MKTLLIYIYIIKVLAYSGRFAVYDIKGIFNAFQYILRKKEDNSLGSTILHVKKSNELCGIMCADELLWRKERKKEECQDVVVTKHQGKAKLLILQIQHFKRFYTVVRLRHFLGVWVPVSKGLYNKIDKIVSGRLDYNDTETKLELTEEFDKIKYFVSNFRVDDEKRTRIYTRSGFKITKVTYGDTLVWEKNDYQEEVIQIEIVKTDSNIQRFYIRYETYYGTADTVFFICDPQAKQVDRKDYFLDDDDDDDDSDDDDFPGGDGRLIGPTGTGLSRPTGTLPAPSGQTSQTGSFHIAIGSTSSRPTSPINFGQKQLVPLPTDARPPTPIPEPPKLQAPVPPDHFPKGILHRVEMDNAHIPLSGTPSVGRGALAKKIRATKTAVPEVVTTAQVAPTHYVPGQPLYTPAGPTQPIQGPQVPYQQIQLQPVPGQQIVRVPGQQQPQAVQGIQVPGQGIIRLQVPHQQIQIVHGIQIPGQPIVRMPAQQPTQPVQRPQVPGQQIQVPQGPGQPMVILTGQQLQGQQIQLQPVPGQPIVRMPAQQPPQAVQRPQVPGQPVVRVPGQQQPQAVQGIQVPGQPVVRIPGQQQPIQPVQRPQVQLQPVPGQPIVRIPGQQHPTQPILRMPAQPILRPTGQPQHGIGPQRPRLGVPSTLIQPPPPRPSGFTPYNIIQGMGAQRFPTGQAVNISQPVSLSEPTTSSSTPGNEGQGPIVIEDDSDSEDSDVFEIHERDGGEGVTTTGTNIDEYLDILIQQATCSTTKTSSKTTTSSGGVLTVTSSTPTQGPPFSSSTQLNLFVDAAVNRPTGFGLSEQGPASSAGSEGTISIAGSDEFNPSDGQEWIDIDKIPQVVTTDFSFEEIAELSLSLASSVESGSTGKTPEQSPYWKPELSSVVVRGVPGPRYPGGSTVKRPFYKESAGTIPGIRPRILTDTQRIRAPISGPGHTESESSLDGSPSKKRKRTEDVPQQPTSSGGSTTAGGMGSQLTYPGQIPYQPRQPTQPTRPQYVPRPMAPTPPIRTPQPTTPQGTGFYGPTQQTPGQYGPSQTGQTQHPGTPQGPVMYGPMQQGQPRMTEPGQPPYTPTPQGQGQQQPGQPTQAQYVPRQVGPTTAIRTPQPTTPQGTGFYGPMQQGQPRMTQPSQTAYHPNQQNQHPYPQSTPTQSQGTFMSMLNDQGTHSSGQQQTPQPQVQQLQGYYPQNQPNQPPYPNQQLQGPHPPPQQSHGYHGTGQGGVGQPGQVPHPSPSQQGQSFYGPMQQAQPRMSQPGQPPYTGTPQGPGNYGPRNPTQPQYVPRQMGPTPPSQTPQTTTPQGTGFYGPVQQTPGQYGPSQTGQTPYHPNQQSQPMNTQFRPPQPAQTQQIPGQQGQGYYGPMQQAQPRMSQPGQPPYHGTPQGPGNYGPNQPVQNHPYQAAYHPGQQSQQPMQTNFRPPQYGQTQQAPGHPTQPQNVPRQVGPIPPIRTQHPQTQQVPGNYGPMGQGQSGTGQQGQGQYNPNQQGQGPQHPTQQYSHYAPTQQQQSAQNLFISGHTMTSLTGDTQGGGWPQQFQGTQESGIPGQGDDDSSDEDSDDDNFFVTEQAGISSDGQTPSTLFPNVGTGPGQFPPVGPTPSVHHAPIFTPPVGVPQSMYETQQSGGTQQSGSIHYVPDGSKKQKRKEKPRKNVGPGGYAPVYRLPVGDRDGGDDVDSECFELSDSDDDETTGASKKKKDKHEDQDKSERVKNILRPSLLGQVSQLHGTTQASGTQQTGGSGSTGPDSGKSKKSKQTEKQGTDQNALQNIDPKDVRPDDDPFGQFRKDGFPLDLLELDDSKKNYVVYVDKPLQVPVIRIIPSDDSYIQELNLGSLIIWRSETVKCVSVRLVVTQFFFGAVELTLVTPMRKKFHLFFRYTDGYYRGVARPRFNEAIYEQATSVREMKKLSRRIDKEIKEEQQAKKEALEEAGRQVQLVETEQEDDDGSEDRSWDIQEIIVKENGNHTNIVRGPKNVTQRR